MESDGYTQRRIAVEDEYTLAASYGFARSFAKGKAVADLRRMNPVLGPELLAGAASSVTTLTSFRAEDFARHEGRFDVVAAFGEIEYHEHPEEFVAGAKRLLKEGGILIISTSDKQKDSNERNREDPARKGKMYVPEFREMLERSFEHVSLHRLGAVSGAVILPENARLDVLPVESADFYSRNLSTSSAPPATRHVLAVCGGPEEVEPRGDGGHLVLDSGGRAFDEGEEAREDARLLREEICHMERTEVLAFEDAVRIAASDRVLTEISRRLGFSRVASVRRAIEVSPSIVTAMSRVYRKAKSLPRRLRRGRDDD